MDDNTDIADVASLTKAVKVGEQLAANALADQVRTGRRPPPRRRSSTGQEFVKPTNGIFTSGFGGRWGTTHYGIDLANKIGTPIYAVTDGTVISSGPASGFGLWVRILHPAGGLDQASTGHINRSLVHIRGRSKCRCGPRWTGVPISRRSFAGLDLLPDVHPVTG